VSQPGTRGAPYVGYQLRSVVVAPDLGALHGPTHGSHQLPRHLDSSARAYFDFAVLGDRTAAYQLVLLEAADVTDHEQWLQRTQLLELWAELYLPRAVRAAWQSAHPSWPGSVPVRTCRSRSGLDSAMTTGAYKVRAIQVALRAADAAAHQP
jgi:hypothetical protein